MKKLFINIILFLLVLKVNNINAQNLKRVAKYSPSLWDKYPWQGQSGIKISGGTHNQFFLDISYMKSDIPKEKLKESDWLIGNQNIFVGLEMSKTYSDFVVAPKIGYEYNLFLLSGRLSCLSYFSTNNHSLDTRILIEPGLTLVGFINVHYGYSFPLSNTILKEINKHRITFSINLFKSYYSDIIKK